MTVRLYNPPPAPKVPSPTTYDEWARLMRQVIERAEVLEHRRLPGLRAAMAKGAAEQHLRSLGIISQTCLDREFPLPK
jgi:hypothetical protein